MIYALQQRVDTGFTCRPKQAKVGDTITLETIAEGGAAPYNVRFCNSNTGECSDQTTAYELDIIQNTYTIQQVDVLTNAIQFYAEFVDASGIVFQSFPCQVTTACCPCK